MKVDRKYLYDDSATRNSAIVNELIDKELIDIPLLDLLTLSTYVDAEKNHIVKLSQNPYIAEYVRRRKIEGFNTLDAKAQKLALNQDAFKLGATLY